MPSGGRIREIHGGSWRFFSFTVKTHPTRIQVWYEGTILDPCAVGLGHFGICLGVLLGRISGLCLFLFHTRHSPQWAKAQ